MDHGELQGNAMRSAFWVFIALAAVVAAFPAQASDVIEIAAIYALTGEATDTNATSVRGARIAVEEINARGGVLGRQLRLEVYDNRSTPIGSHLAAERAADSDAVAILGASRSPHSLPIAKVAQARGVPMITNHSTDPSITRVGNCIFRVCFTDEVQGAALARFAREDLKASTATLFVNLASEYSTGICQVFQKHFEQLGGRVILVREYKSRQRDFADLVRDAGRVQADVLFLSGYDESGLIALLAQDKGVTSKFVGGDGLANPSFLAKGGDRLKRAYYSSHWSPAMDSRRSREFTARYGDVPDFGTGTVLAYDAVMVLADAIKRAGSAERGRIRAALAETRSFEGVTGVISFNGHGDPVKSVVIMEVRDGRPRYLKTMLP